MWVNKGQVKSRTCSERPVGPACTHLDKHHRCRSEVRLPIYANQAAGVYLTSSTRRKTRCNFITTQGDGTQKYYHWYYCIDSTHVPWHVHSCKSIWINIPWLSSSIIAAWKISSSVAETSAVQWKKGCNLQPACVLISRAHLVHRLSHGQVSFFREIL